MASEESHSSYLNEGETETDGAGENAVNILNSLKKKRATHRGKITRSIKRARRFISEGADARRIKQEVTQIRKDFELAREYHAEIYIYGEEGQTSNLDDWEDELINDFYDIDGVVEKYLHPGSPSVNADSSTSEQTFAQSIESNSNETAGASMPEGTQASAQPSTSEAVVPDSEAGNNVNAAVSNAIDSSASAPVNDDDVELNSPADVSLHADSQQNSNPSVNTSSQAPFTSRAFDSWIDDLTEFQETVLQNSVSEMSVAQALYKLEASKDIPSIELLEYNGDPLTYVEFMERFKLHIHDRPHLSDNVRMVQLTMHLTGRAQCAISGLGSQGKMYATALKTLKEQFGTPSAIARARIRKLLDRRKIQSNDRQALQELSFDVVNCVATLKQINHLADANSIYNLRDIVKRLPDNLIDRWKTVVSEIREKGEAPSLENIGQFLRKRVKAEFDPDFGDIQKSETRNPSRERRGIASTQREKKQIQCYVCSENHRVLECPAFASCSNEEKIQHVKKQRLCFSCLNRGHVTKECRSKVKCGVNDCNQLHHRLLHVDAAPVTSNNKGISAVMSALDKDGLMPVVTVRFKSSNGNVREGNVLIDSGAGTTVIRKSLAKELGLQGKKEKIDIAVVGGKRVTQDDSRRVQLWISPLNGNESFPVEAHEIDYTIINVPSLDRTWLGTFDHLKDVDFPHRAGPIDLILGVQYSHLHAESEVRQGLPFQPVAKKTRLGWHVIGPDNANSSPVSYLGLTRKINLETFYEFETVGVRAPDCECPVNLMTNEGEKAMELFEASCEKSDGRYTIGLPWKQDPAGLPNSYPVARQRLESLEKSLSKNPAKAKMYDEAVKEYERHGWARKLEDDEVDNPNAYYLPHHGVYRPEKKSTPLRIVFDPASVYKSVSLNSFLYKGPCLIGNLLGVLLRFREEEVAFVGDISKMFLQIRLRESDCQMHRFLWRNMDTTKEPATYILLRVTFGDKPSPDMASFVMLKIAEENRSRTREASTVIERDRYVDDLIHSCPSVRDGKKRIDDIQKILGESGFTIKEWHCSHPDLQEFVNTTRDVKSLGRLHQSTIQSTVDKDASSAEVNLDKQEVIKALGVSYNPRSDSIHFKVQLNKKPPYTKRSVLSSISRIFDPLGLATAVTIKARMALQELWKTKQFGWDDPLPDNLQEAWDKIFKEMEDLSTIHFPRCLKPHDAKNSPQLHVFSDVSIHAYGAAAYLLWPRTEGVEVRLVTAKARVAPLKQTTIPRLELMAALLASRLAKTVHDEFKTKPTSVTFWTDSMIVLAWIRAESTALKPFVGVRVTEIQTAWEQCCWRFVPTDQNPADDLSRGIPVQKLRERWMKGPAFLRSSPDKWPSSPNIGQADLPEAKNPRPILFLNRPNNTSPLIDPSRFSNWQKLCRITAYCLRFIKNIKGSAQRLSGPLEPEEIETAEIYWIKTAQKELGDWKLQYSDLAPFQQDGIVRVGGRITRSSLQFGEAHPVLLPAKHVVSTLVARDAHNRVLHAGRERTLCECRAKYWILQGRNLVKKMVKDCVTCRKLRQYPHSTLMADLPSDRLKLFAPAFTVTGVDLFGPFYLKYGRNKKTKAWGAVFTCATVRAIHLEIVQDLSTEAFLHALRRFAAHHGWPQTIISDNGTSFVGAEAELRKLVQEDRKQLEDFAVSHKLRWKFNTPASPHQGGFFESMVKLTKAALKVVVGQQTLSWNDMATVFAEVECLVNSRPLGYPSDDANDLQPLTANHLLLGRASPNAPQGPFQEVKSTKKRFYYIQSLIQQFWQRFQREYLQSLIRRSKWKTKKRQPKVGDIVMLMETSMPRGKWNLARITQLLPGKDGVVRNVCVQTKSGLYKRSVQKCCFVLEEDA